MQEMEQKCRESGWKYEKCGNQCWNVGNQNGNLGIAVEMTQNSNGKDKFNKWIEVKIVENEHICKNLVSYI